MKNCAKLSALLSDGSGTGKPARSSRRPIGTEFSIDLLKAAKPEEDRGRHIEALREELNRL